MQIDRVTLAGRFVRLEPLTEQHIPGLARAGLHADLWRYMLYGNVDTPEKMRHFVLDLLRREAAGGDLPFAVVNPQTREPIGCTRYLDIEPRYLRLEIGGTWYAPEWQRTRVNTECKFLLLRHAFENLGCIRVQFKTDILNTRSQLAIERIGAVREGVLRNHMIRPDGTVRDSVIYSIIDAEWPAVSARLQELLAR
jgi:RimJ/RimL family protein N-acetyltransferase